MFNRSNISASFNLSTLEGSRAFGYGSIDFAGVSVNYTVYPSQYGLGIFVSLPNAPKMKDGVQVRDANGKPSYTNFVFIRDPSLRSLVDEAVIDAMANKGVYVQQTAEEVVKNGGHVTSVVSPPSSSFNSPSTTSFANPNATKAVEPTPVVNKAPEIPRSTSSVIGKKDLPF